jgi:hypothetical protein
VQHQIPSSRAAFPRYGGMDRGRWVENRH